MLSLNSLELVFAYLRITTTKIKEIVHVFSEHLSIVLIVEKCLAFQLGRDYQLFTCTSLMFTPTVSKQRQSHAVWFNAPC